MTSSRERSEVTATLGLPTEFTVAGPVVEVDAPDGRITLPVRVRLAGDAPHLARSRSSFTATTSGDGRRRRRRTPMGSTAPKRCRSRGSSLAGSKTPPDGWHPPPAAWSTLPATSSTLASTWVTGRTDPPEPCGQDPYRWVAASGSPPDWGLSRLPRAEPDRGWRRTRRDQDQVQSGVRHVDRRPTAGSGLRLGRGIGVGSHRTGAQRLQRRAIRTGATRPPVGRSPSVTSARPSRAPSSRSSHTKTSSLRSRPS